MGPSRGDKSLLSPGHPVLPSISEGYPGPQGRYPCLTAPYAGCHCWHPRLACLIHAANVRSEPGSNPSIVFPMPPCGGTHSSVWTAVRHDSKNSLGPATSALASATLQARMGRTSQRYFCPIPSAHANNLSKTGVATTPNSRSWRSSLRHSDSGILRRPPRCVNHPTGKKSKRVPDPRSGSAREAFEPGVECGCPLVRGARGC